MKLISNSPFFYCRSWPYFWIFK